MIFFTSKKYRTEYIQYNTNHTLKSDSTSIVKQSKAQYSTVQYSTRQSSVLPPSNKRMYALLDEIPTKTNLLLIRIIEKVNRR